MFQDPYPEEQPYPISPTYSLNNSYSSQAKPIKPIDFKFPYNNASHETHCFNLVEKKIPYSKMKDRKIVTNRVDDELPDNSIVTSRYTPLSFLPKNLLEQFSKKANLYFLFIGVMQTFPYISISNGLPIIFLPLFVIILISAIKDYFEDYKKKMSDKEENMKEILILNKDEKFEKRQWKSVQVGNIVMLRENDYIPADLLILKTTESKGICYIETKNLDGETNMKIRWSPEKLRKIFEDENFSEKIILDYERPNPYLYNFSGKCQTKNQEVIEIDNNNVLLRGCSIKHTKMVYGLVLYTGHESKIMLNTFKTRRKRSKLERIMGKQILIIFLVQSALCLFCSLYYVIWYKINDNSLNYLGLDKNSLADTDLATNFFIRYGNWTLICLNFVPISLLVTLEMVQFIQGLFISHYDKDMMNVDKDLSSTVQSSNLNEELGQVEHIFSDKTGTLTCNVMDFRVISISGSVYGWITEDDSNYIRDLSDYPQVEHVEFRDKSLLDVLTDEHNTEFENVRLTLFILATCHSVLIQRESKEAKFSNYTATSPDEAALVNFAKFCGVEYMGTDENKFLSIKFKDNLFKLQILSNLEFNSKRKRHSVIVKNSDGRIFLFSKGADTVMYERYNKYSVRDMNKVYNHIEEFSKHGLRTLAIGFREISQGEYESWSKKYEAAQKSTNSNDKEQKIEELEEEIENSLEIIAATGIEDKLQKDVGSTIQALKDAGIKVWVLTGDKIETAINIAFSCRLLDNDMNRFIIEDKDQNSLEKHLDEILEKMNNETEKNLSNNALIISGDSLLHMVIPFIYEKVIKISSNSRAVLCCRVSPKQKQEIVSFVREKNPNLTTLAIGDGANDVNMITAAHVGVGIRGREGHQAARSSDYSISEFRLLRKLLFVHGRECYRRNSALVCYNFFKNICLVLPQFWFGFSSSFSGQTLYDSYIYQMFNIFYASVPIFLFAIFDQEYPNHVLFENRINYYEEGIKNRLFNNRVFWSWFIFGTMQSIIICFFNLYALEGSFVNENGLNLDFWSSGTAIFGMAVVVSNVKILLMSNCISFLNSLIIFLSLILYLFSLIIISNIPNSDIYMLMNRMFTSSNFHFGNYLILCTTGGIDYAFTLYQKFSKRLELERKADKMKNKSTRSVTRFEHSKMPTSFKFPKRQIESIEMGAETESKKNQIFFKEENGSGNGTGAGTGRNELNASMTHTQFPNNRDSIISHNTKKTLIGSIMPSFISSATQNQSNKISMIIDKPRNTKNGFAFSQDEDIY